jgi:tRNA-dihydrouridine synthase
MIGARPRGAPGSFARSRIIWPPVSCCRNPRPSGCARPCWAHLDELYSFYGEARGVRIARKHIGWYCHDSGGTGRATGMDQAVARNPDKEVREAKHLSIGASTQQFLDQINRSETAAQQLGFVVSYFSGTWQTEDAA